MTYILSDIHGEYELFCRLMDKVRFSDADLLISCGDVVEKGRHSIRLAQLLFSMKNAVLLAGNHEYAFLKYYWGLLQRSPADFDSVLRFLQKYFPDDGELLDWETVDRFEAMPYYYEAENYICVHAGAPLDREGRILPLKEASPEQLVYDRIFKDPGVLPRGGKCVFFGHTPTVNLGFAPEIKCYPREEKCGNGVENYYKIHLDTGTWISGVLGCFRVEDCRRFYVNKE